MYYCFIISIAVLFGYLGFLLIKKRRITFKQLIPILAISIFVLILPFYSEFNTITQVLLSIIFSVKSIAFAQDIDLIGLLDLSSTFNLVYYIYLNLLFIVFPLTTFFAILVLANNLKNSFYEKYYKHKQVYLFSEINDKSISIARVAINKGYTVVFGSINIKEGKQKLSDIKALIYERPIEEIHFNNAKEVHYFYIKENCELNIEESLKSMNVIHSIPTTMHIFNEIDEYNLLIDSAIKNVQSSNIHIDIVNTYERSIQNLLYNYPLYLNSKNNTISLLIVGTDKFSKELLKTAIWCGQIPEYKLKITIVGENADKLKSQLMLECPELIDNYDISFNNVDVTTIELINTITTIKPNYVTVSLANDMLNLKTAIQLKRYFSIQSPNFVDTPLICININNEYEKNEIEKLTIKSNTYYNFVTFGTIDKNYYKDFMFDMPIENIAKQINLVYSPTDTNFINYYSNQRSRSSSRAHALHIKYKMFAVLNNKYPELFTSPYTPLTDMLKQYVLVKNDSIKKKLAQSEHERWNAYFRCLGYSSVSPSIVKMYLPYTSHHCHELAKLHPAIVPYDKLEEIEKQLNIELKRYDLDIVQAYPDIIHKAFK